MRAPSLLESVLQHPTETTFLRRTCTGGLGPTTLHWWALTGDVAPVYVIYCQLPSRFQRSRRVAAPAGVGWTLPPTIRRSGRHVRSASRAVPGSTGARVLTSHAITALQGHFHDILHVVVRGGREPTDSIASTHAILSSVFESGVSWCVVYLERIAAAFTQTHRHTHIHTMHARMHTHTHTERRSDMRRRTTV
jgi:hypothetical protein